MALLKVNDRFYVRLSLKNPVTKKTEKKQFPLHLKANRKRNEKAAKLLAERFQELAADYMEGKSELPSRSDITKMVDSFYHALGIVEDEHKIGTCIISYLSEKENEITKRTLKHATSTLLTFGEWAEKKGLTMSTVTEPDLVEFRSELLKDQMATTVNQKIRVISGLFTYGVKRGMCVVNPAKIIKPLKQERTTRVAFTEEDVALLLQNTKEMADDPRVTSALRTAMGEMHYAIVVASTIGTAMTDTSRLEWAHVDFERSVVIKRRQKTGTLCIAPFFNGLGDALREWKKICPSDTFVFPYMRKVSDVVKQANLQRVMERAGIDNGLHTKASGMKRTTKSWHSFRNYAINSAIDLGIPEDIRMQIFGHVGSDIHRHYADYDIERIRKQIPGSEVVEPKVEAVF